MPRPPRECTVGQVESTAWTRSITLEANRPREVFAHSVSPTTEVSVDSGMTINIGWLAPA